jgi:hypothetical protein
MMSVGVLVDAAYSFPITDDHDRHRSDGGTLGCRALPDGWDFRQVSRVYLVGVLVELGGLLGYFVRFKGGRTGSRGNSIPKLNAGTAPKRGARASVG